MVVKHAWALVAAGAVLVFVAEANAADQPKHVLMLNEFRPDTNINVERDGIYRAALTQALDGQVDYYAEYIDAAAFSGETYERALRDFLRLKYHGKHIEVVIAAGEVALTFMQTYGEELFPAASIVASDLSRDALERARQRPGMPVTGVARRLDPKGTLDLILRLQPDTKAVVFVAGGAYGRQVAAQARAELRAYERRIALEYLVDLPMDDWLERLAMLPPGTAVIFLTVFQDGAGQRLLPTDALLRITQASAVPVYGIISNHVNYGIVGGSLHDSDILAKAVIDMTVRVLRGTSARDIPVTDANSIVPMVNWVALRRWGLSEDRLPAGTVVVRKELTAWERYRWLIAGALALFVVQAVMIGGLVLQRARRREIEERNAAILRAMPDMMFLQTREGVYLDYHAPHANVLLVEPEQFIGKHMREVFPPELAAVFEDHFARLTGREPTIIEYTLSMPDGRRHYEARIVPCANNEVLSVVRDITARKTAKAALSKSEERYALATAAGSVGVWDWNLETNELYVDPSVKAMLGYRDDEIRNHPDEWACLFHPDDRDAAIEGIQAHVRSRSQTYEVEHRMLHRDGSIRWFVARGSAVRRDGVAVRIIGTETDITERKMSEHALHEAQAELARVSRLTALGEFAASIAHEVAQPLTAIMMNAKTCLRWLGSESPDLTEIRAAVWDVIEASRRADDVIRRNRELFRHHTVQKAPVEMNAVIREVAVLAAVQLQGSHVTMTTSLGAMLPTIVADRVELQQVLLNLIVNAIDAMESVAPGSRRIEIVSSLANGDGVQVSVRDNGVGLDGVDMDRMFAPSYTTKANGTGVGLSISRSIVEAHGGRLWAEPNADRGATFSFTVPVHPDAAGT